VSHANPRNVFDLDGEISQENHNPQSDTQTKTLARLVHRTKIRGAVTKAEGEVAEAEVVAGAEAIKRKGSGTIFSTKRMTTIAQTIAQTRKYLKLSSKKRRRRKRGTIP
jgi:hypothetical protein